MTQRQRFRPLPYLLVMISLFAFAAAYATDNYPKNPNIDVQHYRFGIILRDDTDEIAGSASIQILFITKGTTQVRLDFTNKDEQGKGMVVETVMLDGSSLNYKHERNELRITLAKPSEAGQHLEIIVTYHGTPAKGLQMKPNKYGERTFFSDNWPDLTRHWLPVVDHPSDKATSEFIVTAPIRYQVVSNGLLLEETNLTTTTKRTHWKQSVPIAPWLYVLGVAEFAVQYVDTFEGKSIQTWVFHQDRDAGFADFQKPTKEVLEFFSSYIGPFSYEKLANIQASSVSGGMEASSAILYNEKCVNGNGDFRWKKVVIHEIAHQWFGCTVTEKDWDDVWLSEGFATYFTALFMEHHYGREDFVNEMKSARRQVEDYYKKNPNDPVVHNNLSDMEKVTSSLTYQKGAWTLHMLRNLIGDEKFERGIKSYYSRYYNINASTADFQFEMEQASGIKLDAFFKQWLNQGGYLSLSGDWNYDPKTKKLRIHLSQTQKDGVIFMTPIEVGVFEKGKTSPNVMKIVLNSQTQTFEVPLDFEAENVVIDPNTVLLATVSFNHK